jgi:hypothetical protein
MSSRLYLILSIGLLLTQVGCKCGNPKKEDWLDDSQPSSNANLSSTSSSPLPIAPPAANKKLDDAIKKLENSVRKGGDARLDRVYNVISILPPHQFKVDLQGIRSRINPEKSGQELFDKVMNILPDESHEVVGWLMEEGLLAPNEKRSDGVSILEQVLSKMLLDRKNYSLDKEKLAKIATLLLDEGATLQPDAASSMLEQWVETIIQTASKKRVGETEKKILDFLKNQGGRVAPSKATSLLTALVNVATSSSLIHDNEKLVINILCSDSSPDIQPSQSTELLKKAIKNKMGKDVYEVLFKLGADPNSRIIKGRSSSVKEPLLFGTNEGLLDVLLANPAVDVNAVDEEKQTLVMRIAYNQVVRKDMQKLLKRPDLDINDKRSDKSGVNGFTFLDIVVANCMAPVIASSARIAWLDVLKGLTTHPKFSVRDDNIAKAQVALGEIDPSSFGTTESYLKAKDITEQAMDILKKNKK